MVIPNSNRGEGSGRPDSSTTIALDELRSGEWAEVVAVDDQNIRTQALRIGICAGARVSCVTRIPAGPVVLGYGRQEIAVGRALAKKISIRRCPGIDGRGVQVDSRPST